MQKLESKQTLKYCSSDLTIIESPSAPKTKDSSAIDSFVALRLWNAEGRSSKIIVGSSSLHSDSTDSSAL